MKSFVPATIATLACVGLSGQALAQSTETLLLQRLEAKVDALAKENATLRERVRKMESSRVASAKPATSLEQTASGDPAISHTARTANAAYMPVKAAPAPYRAPCAQFGGWYAGAHVGWGYYDHQFSDRDGLGDFLDSGLPDSVSARKSGVNVGPQLGYNWQSGCALFGLETDWSWTSVKNNVFSTDGDGAAVDTLRVDSHLRWFGTARARAGVVVDNLLLYATGGLAFANFDRTFTYFQDAPATLGVFSSSDTRFGLVGGVGAEWALANNWSIKGELLYMRFEDDSTSITGDGIIGAAGATYRLDSLDSIWVGRIGLNVKLGDWGKGPVVAKY
jgi:outer membrane immunogenic protein